MMWHILTDRIYNIFTNISTKAVQQGPVPEHVAIIMDGNRRYARNRGLPLTDGHLSGRKKAEEILVWMNNLGVQEITYYAFSIENFKRPKEEVNFLMELLGKEMGTNKMLGLELAEKHGICYEIIGDWDLFPESMKSDFANLMIKTRKNTLRKINIAFAYTARNAMERSVSAIEYGLSKALLNPEDVTESLIYEASVLNPIRKVDWLIRTSGEQRLSDFVLLEASNAFISFIPASFPELSFSSVLLQLFEYQKFKKSRKEFGKDIYCTEKEEEGKRRRELFLENIRAQQWKMLEEYIKN